MKLLFWRRKPKQAEPQTHGALAALPSPLAPDTTARLPATTDRVDRSALPTRPLAMPPEVRDSVLRFAVDALAASGAKVRIEAEDLITATLPNGDAVRYTTTLARAREDEATQLLVQGGATLADLVERCAEHTALGALALTERVDPVGAARAGLAEPPITCHACVADYGDGDIDICAQCPLRAGQVALRGMGQLTGGNVMRQWDAWSIELTYEIAYSDRQGRRAEWQRLAFDASSSHPRSVLDPEALRSAQPAAQPPELITSIGELAAHADDTLHPPLAAGAAFLRLRSEHDFRERLADLDSTTNRLLRETPEDAPRIAESLQAEIERLRDVFAVDVEAHLHSICFIASPHAAVAFERAGARPLTVTVDLGRGALLPPSCVACGNATTSGTVCANGHVTCRTCARRGDLESACVACASASGDTPPASSRRKRTSAVRSSSDDDPLTMGHLRDMTHETWREFTAWLIEQDGMRLERGDDHDAMIVWRGHTIVDDAPVVVVALRPPASLCVSDEDIRHAVAAAGMLDNARLRIISASLASASAAHEAHRLGIELMGGDALAQRLETLVAHQVYAREAEREAASLQAAAAAHAREAVLMDLRALEEILARAVNSRRASGRAAVATAAITIRAAREEALRAFLAWDTLADEWIASFDERAGRDGALVILTAGEQFGEMAERAAHLRAATLTSLASLASTPGGGELGYGAWRRAVMEELTARCEGCRWRLLAIDPARWDDFTAAHDTSALEHATSAQASAAHAAARVAKTYGDLAQRARL